MKRSPRVLLALAAPFVLAWSASVLAGNCSAGKAKFQEICQSCHTAASRAGRSAADIFNALGGQSAMQGLYPEFVDATDVDNIAEYLFVFPAACPAAPPPPPTVTAVEYYHSGFDHYFITWVGAEIDNLDSGRTKGWTRTGLSFNVYTSAQIGTSAVCRIYIPPGKGDGHYFGRDKIECDGTMTKNPTFILESDAFFFLYPPNLGTCAAGTVPVYRVYSNRIDANHRYTTDRAERDQMMAKGWLAEGDGPDIVVMCAPP